jgi:cell division inhibitor SepF
MANSLRKVANYLGLMDDPEEDSPQVIETKAVHGRLPDVKIKTREANTSFVSGSIPAMQLDLPVLDRIVTIHPRFYNEARTLGEHYRLGNPVIMNLSDMEENERKRLVDFASGLVFGHHGTIERVTSKVFLLSPANIRVSSEDKVAAAEASFFNQS